MVEAKTGRREIKLILKEFLHDFVASACFRNALFHPIAIAFNGVLAERCPGSMDKPKATVYP